MGQNGSRSTSPEHVTDGDESKPSVPGTLRRRSMFHRRSHKKGSDSSLHSVHSNDFAGIVCIESISAEMKSKDKWFACLSLGERTYRTETSEQVLKLQKKKIVMEKDGPKVARVSVFETHRLSKSVMIGFCEIDLVEILSQPDPITNLQFSLVDPVASDRVVAMIKLSLSVEDPKVTELSFARRVLSIVDYNQDGILNFKEFSNLIAAFGNKTASSKSLELFREADKNGDGSVSVDELSILLAAHQEKEPLISSCPVCGEKLESFDKLNAVIHLTLCFDEGTGNQIMTGGFLTENQASNGWMFKLSEWAHFSSYDVGLHSGSKASHILVFDRITKRLVEETIDSKIILSMRALYQSKIGLTLVDNGTKSLLQSISEKQGKKMSSPESAKKIPEFVEFFKDQINLDEMVHPIGHYKTFNDFFTRELKEGARPITEKERDDVAICAADCRLSAFENVEDSKRFWIKGRKFSVKGLLGLETCSSAFEQGSLVIFRLAPQDYHRFHSPVSGVIEKFVDIPGALYTVNPIAVNSNYCNVFTENKRVISVISTKDFGKVAFVAIGATMVGSIRFLKKEGDYVGKGDPLGYFAFGGSTVICVFEKDALEIDEDLLSNSRRSLETLVRVGMKLGVSRRSN